MPEKHCISCMRKIGEGETVCPHCGYDAAQYKPPDHALPPGSALNDEKYVIGRVLGRGGFGVTYVALDQNLDLRVAIKECLPRNAAWRDGSGASVKWGVSVPEQESAMENFVREARKMAKIDQIPGVVRVREYFYDNDTAYIVMDYVDGETLAARLRRTGPLSAEECFRLLRPVMDALEQAHRRGLVHRDISPNNIMIARTEDGGEQVWLLDLGAAKDLGTRLSAPNVSAETRIVGTPGYTPLEQYSPDGRIGPWTDVHALSAVFFYAMTGKKPPASTSRALETQMPEVLQSVPGPVGDALRKGMALRPEGRYQTMPELRDAIEKAVKELSHIETYDGTTEILPQESEKKPPRKKRVLAPLLILLLALALVPLGIMLTRPKSVTPENESEPLEDTAQLEGETSAEIIASGECGYNASWTLEKNGLLTISGTGEMWDYDDRAYKLAPWAEYKSQISHIEIAQGITRIGTFAFQECENLRTIEIPDSVTQIRADAFRFCTSLSNMAIPNGVTEIEYATFQKCVSLTDITIPNSVTIIGLNAFDGCSSLKSVTIPYGVKKICMNAFLGCSGLSSVTIPDSVTIIEEHAFRNCSSLSSVVIPDSVQEIGDMAFRNCINLKSVSIGANTAFTENYPSSNTFDSDTTVMRR